MRGQADEVRAFNRFYTGLIGLLNEYVGQSRFRLPEARLLFEIATRGSATGADLARGMGVDRAHVTRLLHKLVGEGLVAITPTPGDRRSNQAVLTQDGDAAFKELDVASAAAVDAMLAPLDPVQRDTLVEAMATIRALLDREESAGRLVLRPHRIGELGWLIHRQGLLYNRQYGWNGDFEALIARIYNEFHFAPEVPAKALWVAERDGRITGSVFAMPSDGVEGSAQLRMLYVEPEARGQGIGRLLVEQCVAFARGAGYERMRLWTHSVQVAARHLYAAAGFELVESSPHRSFGKLLESEIWELRF